MSSDELKNYRSPGFMPPDYGSDIRVIAQLRERNAKLVAAMKEALAFLPSEQMHAYKVLTEALQQSTEKP